MDLAITLVQTKADKRSFYHLPWQVYRGDPHWVPPLWPQRKEYLDKKAAFFTFGEGDFWLARLDGRVVGTIGTAINHSYNMQKGARTGVFGFFEVLPPGSVPGYGEAQAFAIAKRLWDHAADWARRRNMVELAGPYSFSPSDEPGFLVEGFDSAPAVMMGHSHPCYPGWAESYGFIMRQNSLAYRFDLGGIEISSDGNVRRAPDSSLAERAERLARIAGRARTRHGAQVIRNPRMADWDAEIDRLHRVYNSSLSMLPEFSPIELAEFRAQAQALKPLIDPELVIIAEVDGRPAGFAFGLPNVMEALHHANGLRHPWDYARFALARRRIASASFKILAIDPEFWGLGLDSAIFLEMGQAVLRKGYTWIDLSLTNELNPQTNKLARRFGARVYRKYQEFRKDL